MAFGIVGLTGGIASGKSTVADMFQRNHNIPIVDADQISREVVEPDTPGLDEIVQAFGTDVLLDDGTLDRKRLGALVFDDDDARAKLNAILHPKVAARSLEKFTALAAQNDAPYALYDAALLVETGSHRMMAALIVVAASPETQRRRIAKRDALSPAEAQQRIDAQLPLQEKIAVADIVIHTDGPKSETEVRVAEVHAALLERFAG